MKKSIFERFIYSIPSWVLSILVYGVGGGIILFLLFFTGCAPFEPVPGLCYTDKTGTYICLKEEKEECPNYDPELDSSATNFCVGETLKEKRAKADARRACSMWLGSDWWFECMNNEF